MAIRIAYQRIPAVPAALGKSPSDEMVKRELIQKVFKASIKEAVIAIVIASIAIAFVAPPAIVFVAIPFLQYVGIPFLIGSTVTMIAVNTTLRCAAAWAKFQIHQLERENPLDPIVLQKKKWLARLVSFVETMCAINFSLLNCRLIYGEVESFAALALFKDAAPQISFTGEALYDISHGPTAFGQLFANMGIDPMAIVSGVGFSTGLVTTAGGLALSNHLKNSHPTLSKYLKVMAGFSLIKSIVPMVEGVVYPLCPSVEGYDWVRYTFCRVFKDSSFLHFIGGFTYLAQLLVMILVPLFVVGAYLFLNRNQAVVAN